VHFFVIVPLWVLLFEAFCRTLRAFAPFALKDFAV